MVFKWILLLLQHHIISALVHHIKVCACVCLTKVVCLDSYLIELKVCIFNCSFASWKVLNEYFHNVCELDLVFNFYKVSILRSEFFPFVFKSLDIQLKRP